MARPWSLSLRREFSVLLPKTKFPMRANAAVRELETVKTTTQRLYEWQESRQGVRTFVLHDGPPYANGELHTGHFMNKTLKDFINRFKVLQGYRVHYIPGWDCHGLPIELKALEKHKMQNNRRDREDAKEIRQVAQDFANAAVKNQKEGFRRWGVMAAWDSEDKVYKTMNKAYEANQLQVFGEMVKRGLVRRGLKPVYWSYSSRTALAEAEIEYVDDHESPSCYVDFKLTATGLKDSSSSLLADLIRQERLVATIWTTTPWTLLSNVAISVHPDIVYCLVTSGSSGHVRLIARERVEDEVTGSLFGNPSELLVLGEVLGRDLEGLCYIHPLEKADTKNEYRLLCGPHVSADAGTGLVHTAPAHGQDDYMVWKRHGGALEDCPSPIDDDGRFAWPEPRLLGAREAIGDESVWATLRGHHIHGDGNRLVLNLLNQKGALPTAPSSFFHRYPYDWRTKRPVITRATEQWFINLTALKPLAENALTKVELVPASSRSRLSSMLQGRDEWCISRQRIWGVPIPALYGMNFPPNCSTPDHWLDEFLVQAAMEAIAREGSDWWFSAPNVEEIVSSRANELRREAGLEPIELPRDSTAEGATPLWKRSTDTLDVWFDSGCSWLSVLGQSGIFPEAHDIVADVYLEGSDQHRGWFQSSLLTKLASTTAPSFLDSSLASPDETMAPLAPFKTIITHGFLLDEHETKMSKSAGNVIIPDDVINGKGSFESEPAYGVDVMRLWVASTDYSGDVTLGKHIIGDISDQVRKVRNVARFLLGNLKDFVPSNDNRKMLEELPLEPLDRYILDRTHAFVSDSVGAYETYRFRLVYSSLLSFVSNDLSAVYSSCIKDRLYCDAQESPSRRAAQAVLWEVLQAVTLVIAPIMCFTAEEIHRFAAKEVAPFPAVPGVADKDRFSVFQSKFEPCPESWKLDSEMKAWWSEAFDVRHTVNRLLSQLKADGTIQTSEQVDVQLVLPSEGSALASSGALDKRTAEKTLENFFLTASCSLSASQTREPVLQGLSEGDVQVRMFVSNRKECGRCRRFTVEQSAPEGSHCVRCTSVEQAS